MSTSSLIPKYFTRLTEEQIKQFNQLEPVYREWNMQINVISRKDIDLLYERHVLHSLGIAKVISFKPGTMIMDVGTGGGFPGIPLAILFPECKFHLIDSIGKKIKVVKEAVQSLGLKNVIAEHKRAEEVKEKFHFIVSRAVTEFPVFYSWVKDKFSRENFNDLPNGILYLKGGDLRQELEGFKKHAEIINLDKFFPGEFFETKKVVYLPA